jgi:hypothetical protein
VSDGDVKFVDALGVPVSQLARALGKSRQAVNRGLRSARDYLKPQDLTKVLQFWRQSDAEFYAVAKDKVCEFYPEIANAILENAAFESATPFSTDIPGEYWFICGDFVAFKAALPSCAQQLEVLCALESAQVKLFLNKGDNIANRWAEKYRDNATQVFPCKTVNLQLLPVTLLRIDNDENVDLFGVSDAGFTALSRQEAARLRRVIEDSLFKDAA